MTSLYILFSSLLAGCGSPTTVTAVDVELGPEIPSVVRLSWDVATALAPEEYTTWLDFGLDSENMQRVPGLLQEETADGARYSVLLLGLPGDSRHQYQVQTGTEQHEWLGWEGTFRTGWAPGSLENLSVDVSDEQAFDDGFLLVSHNREPAAALILNRQGQYVWWYVDERPEVSCTAARFSVDGQWVLVNAFDAEQEAEDNPVGEIIKISLDGHTVETLDVPRAHHDFTQLPDGTIAALSYDFRDVDDRSIRGDRIVEVDGEGSVTEVWNAWDYLEFDPQFVVQGAGWTHANALDYDQEQDAYYVSLHNYNAIVKIQRSDYQVEWMLGGDLSDFHIVDTRTFRHQHQFQRIADHLLVYDNGTQDELSSRVVELALDETDMQASLVWEYVPDPTVFTVAMGDVHRFESGNTLAVFGAAGQLDEVDASGQMVWRVRSQLGGNFGFSEFVEDLNDL